ncbi:MAG: allantoinase [Polyangiaceae bacterium]|jgi:allantoinase|nr:allantoinase [Polyangiaceae bacterium]
MSVTAYRSSRVVLPSGVEEATVLVEGERIAEVVRGPRRVASAIDFGDRVIGPGLVDCHVHVNEPGRTEWEGFDTATRAAAAGGVTALVDMPLNSLPVTTTAAALEQKKQASAGKCRVDVGFWGGVVPGNRAELGPLAEGGVLGCKAFLVHSGIDEFPNTSATDLREAMPVLRDAGLPLLAHAELDLGAALTTDDRRTYERYLASRPPAWEDAAIELLVELCRETRCPVHIVHLSSASSVPLLRAAKAEGLPITVETCPHYLCLQAESIPDGATFYKCAPPIRDAKNRDALWGALLEGVIDFVITDHSPCLPSLKLPESGDFEAAWGGIASLQLGLPAVWTEARKRGAGLAELFRWMSSAPARFAGFSARKGRIAAGLDADLLVLAPEEERLVSPEQLFFRHKVSPYLGQTLYGRVHATLLRGACVYDGQSHPGEPRGIHLLHRGAPE